MEIFIPSLFVFLVALVITFLVAPRATPFMAGILSVIFLAFGVYDHYKMFETEYRQSTWQTGLRIYAPAVMILAIFLFILAGIVSFFTGGSVPVPSIPNVNLDDFTNLNLPTMNTVTNNVSNLFNNAVNTAVNTANDVANNVAEVANETINTLQGVSGNNKNNKNKGNTSRSFLETI